MSSEQKNCIENDAQLEKLLKHESVLRDSLDEQSWAFVAQKLNLTESFMRHFSDILPFRELCYHQKLTEDFIDEFEDEIDWESIFVNQKHVSEEFILSHMDKVRTYRFSNLDYSRKYSNYFININKRELQWNKLTFQQCKDWNMDFINKFKDFLNWDILMMLRDDLQTIEFVKKFESKIELKNIMVSEFNEDFIDEFIEGIDKISIIKSIYPLIQNHRKQ